MRGPSRKHDAWALSSSVVSLQFLSDGMADLDSYGNPERDIEHAFLTLKRGTQLVKYSRKGKPKLCNFRLSQVSFLL